MSFASLASDVVFVSYALVTAALALVGLYYGLLALERFLRSQRGEPRTVMGPPENPPMVTVQIPVYNERYVVDRVLDAVSEFDWPASKLEVQIIDDSTDGTTEVIAAAVDRIQLEGLDVTHINREDRTGYKAGATQAGLKQADGEFIALFDADFVPAPDFLERTVPLFEDDRVGCVQTRWAHLNEEYSWFTRAQALALDAHFAVEQWVRAQVGSLMSFNATSCVWRRETIDAVGGWSSDTVAEDLDLTAAALQDEWRFVYTEGYAVPCEIPVTLSGFVRQQTRWAKGSAQNVRKHLRGLLSAPTLSLWARFHSVFHVTHYLFYPLLLAWILLHVAVTFSGDVPTRLLLAGFLGATPGPLIFLALGQVYTDRPGRVRRLLSTVPLTLVGVGMAWRMSRAVIGGLVEGGGRFVRTPKFRIEGPRRSWRDRAYDQPLESVAPELVLGIWCVLGVGLAIWVGAYRMVPSIGFFGACFGTVAAYARLQS